MNDQSEINIFKALDYIRNSSAALAKAKADRVYLEEFRKTKKAILMKLGEVEGCTSATIQERFAYSHPEYMELLNSLKIAVEEEERLKWMMIACQAKIEVFRTLQANARFEAKVL